MEKKILVLASGRGTDFQAIVDHQKLGIFEGIKIEALLCNHENAPVVERAKDAGISVLYVPGITGRRFDTSAEKETARAAFDLECSKWVRDLEINLLVLAGFDQILGRMLVDSHLFKVLNIHPAYDLIRFGGKNMVGRKVHEEVLRRGATFSGCKVHFVTNDLDMGRVILK